MRSRLVWAAVVISCVLLLVPFDERPDRFWDTVLVNEWVGIVVAVGALLTLRLVKAPRAEEGPMVADEVEPRGRKFLDAALLAESWLFWLGHWSSRLSTTNLTQDDFIYLRTSYPASALREHLWEPFNEHCVLLPRLWTFALVSASPSDVLAATVVGRILLATLIALLFAEYLRRSLKSCLGALLAVNVLLAPGPTAEVMSWYAASLWLWPVLLLVVGLHAVRWAPGRPAWALAALGAGFLGPLAFWTGILVSPLLALQAWLQMGDASCRRRLGWMRLVPTGLALAGLGGAALAATVSEDRTARSLSGALHLTSIERTLLFSARFATDHLILSNLGMEVSLSAAKVVRVVILAVAGLMLLTLCARARRPSWFVVPLIAIVLGYGLAFLFRNDIAYEPGLRRSTRYQLLPQLGLAWFVAVVVADRLPSAARLFHRRSVGAASALLIALWWTWQSEVIRTWWQLLLGPE
jgi:hypothetical protein